MTRILGLANYLGHEQLTKQGLRIASPPDVLADTTPAGSNCTMDLFRIFG
jgi:hypothetical protein